MKDAIHKELAAADTTLTRAEKTSTERGARGRGRYV